MKKVIISAFFLMIILSVSISAVFESCSVKLRANCDGSGEGTILMNLSDSTNAHGEFTTGSGANYGYVLCCNFAASRTCIGSGPDNKVIGLSAATNAHAEIPGNNNYATDVCYGSLSCTSASSCDSSQIQVASLASATNSHIGAFGDYSNKICCTLSSVEDVYWSDDMFGFNERVTPLSVVPDSSPSIYLVLKNAGLSNGTDVNFEIYEDDGASGDDDVRTGSSVTAKYYTNTGKAVAMWNINSADINAAKDSGLDNGPYEFYFIANGIQSEEIIVDVLSSDTCNSIVSCVDYDESLCDSDPCNRAIELEQSGTDCSVEDCFCSWNSNISACGASFLAVSNETEIVAGLCTATIDSSIDPLGCADDGQLTYKLIKTWSGEGSAPENCQPETTVTFSCPAEIQLPFFDIYNFAITAVLIGLIYIIILRKQKR